MQQALEQIQRLFSMIPDPAMRNCVALAVCIILYGVFISGTERRKPRATHRAMRSPDSVLRDVVVR
jgi:hypothetical protein